MHAESGAFASRPHSPQIASGKGRMAREIAILETTEAVGRSFLPFFYF
jgi:hypothetical protein